MTEVAAVPPGEDANERHPDDRALEPHVVSWERQQHVVGRCQGSGSIIDFKKERLMRGNHQQRQKSCIDSPQGYPRGVVSTLLLMPTTRLGKKEEILCFKSIHYTSPT